MNKVIILGGDHYNALGIVRSFGVNGIKPYGILTTVSKNPTENFCFLSKYWEKTWFALSDKEALVILKREFSHEDIKPVLVPSSDGMAYEIDTHYDELKQWFILPNINCKQGEIAKLMDKKTQTQWAHQLGLRTAKTWCVELSDDLNGFYSEVFFPCILKPVISSEGHKTDISKCENLECLKGKMTELKRKGYHRILVQEFLTKDFEAELFGCIAENTVRIPYLLSKHVREWPPIGGSVSCHQFLKDENLVKQAEHFLHQIRDYGYRGNIDIELFVINGNLVLNEVNFRNSGDVYACFRQNVHYPVFSYLDMIGEDTSNMNTGYSTKYYAMNETTDFRHVLYGNLKLKEWLKYWKNSKDYAYWFKGDMKPCLRKYKYFLKKMITRTGNNES